MRSETADDDGSGNEGVSDNDDATPKKGSGKKGKKTINGTKETRTTGRFICVFSRSSGQVVTT